MSAFREQITDFTRQLGAMAAKQLADLAKAETAKILAAQTARRGIAPGIETAVDGDRSKSIDQVKPGGTIFEQFDYRREIVQVCFDELRARSPRSALEKAEGHYADKHYVLLDGQPLAPLTLPTQEQLWATQVVMISNPQPYARRLEVGRTVRQVEPHIFEGAMLAVRREYGPVAKFDFKYIDLSDAYVLKTNTFRTGRNGRSTASLRRDRSRGAAIQYPAIVIARS